jgi:hypothetical protein
LRGATARFKLPSLPYNAGKSKFESGKGKSGIRNWQTGGCGCGVFFTRNIGIIVAVRKCDVILFQRITRIFECGRVAVRTRATLATEGGKHAGRFNIQNHVKGSPKVRRPSFLRASEL